MRPPTRFTHVHQILPSLHVADASGAHTLRAREALREAGFESELFVDLVDAPLEREVRRFDELDSFVVPGQTALLYQLAVGSRLVDALVERREPLLVNYHNLTPASFYWEWAPDWLEAVAMGRSQLYELANHTRHAIAVSEFNEQDLRGAGYRSTSVVAPFVETKGRAGSGPGTRRNDGPTNWLFVGKLLPHKAAEDLVASLAAYRRVYDTDARLVLVGGHPIAGYAKSLADYAGSLGLEDAVDLKGATSAEELADSYGQAHVFVCLSDHEGFCFPLLEAMSYGIPIVAFAAAAVPATLGDAGILLEDKSAPQVAAAVHRVLSDARTRERLILAGHRRLLEFDLETTKSRFVEHIEQALARTEEQEREEEADKLGAPRLERRFEELTPTAPTTTGAARATLLAHPVGAGPPARQGRQGRQGRAVRELRAVHQFLPMLVPNDATSEHAIELRRLLLEMGFASEIFATAVHDELHDEGLLLRELPDRRLSDTAFVYQMSSGSPLVELARDREEPLAVNYHNLTPAEIYEDWDRSTASEQRWARRQLSQLAARAEIGICDSGYNARELESMGYARTSVAPVLFDTDRFEVSNTSRNTEAITEVARVEQELEERSAREGSWLFVGRIAPHKAQHRVVEALAVYARMFGETPRFDIVGSAGSVRYEEALRRQIGELELAGRVSMVGGVTDGVLGAYYRRASVFVSASVHEGFGVPIVEAMHHGVPVLAVGAGAVPETVQSAGLLFDEFDAAGFAVALRRVSEEGDLRSRLVAAGRERAEQLSLKRSRETMREVIERWTAGGAR